MLVTAPWERLRIVCLESDGKASEREEFAVLGGRRPLVADPRDIFAVTFERLLNPMKGPLSAGGVWSQRTTSRGRTRRRQTRSRSRARPRRRVERRELSPGGGPRMAPRGMNERRFAQVSRRELLKVAPVLALGAFAIPSFQESLLKKGLGFSDWASARLFRRGHLGADVCGCRADAVRKVSHQWLRRG